MSINKPWNNNRFKKLALSIILAFSICASSGNKITQAETKHNLSELLDPNTRPWIGNSYAEELITMFEKVDALKHRVSDL